MVACCLNWGVAKSPDVQAGGVWLASFDNGDVSDWGLRNERLKYWFDGHLRYFDDTDGFGQSIVRPGLGWKLSEQTTLWAGYAWIRTSPVQGGEFAESRFWQQWTQAGSLADSKTLLRSRVEQRWVETGDDVGLRFRQLARWQRPFENHPQTSLVLWDEIFWNLNDADWGARSGFDQNRLFIGLGFQPCRCGKNRIELGYLLQTINTAGESDRQNHLLSINFFR